MSRRISSGYLPHLLCFYHHITSLCFPVERLILKVLLDWPLLDVSGFILASDKLLNTFLHRRRTIASSFTF